MKHEVIRRFRAQLREIERRVARTLKDQTSCCGVTMAQCHVLLEMGEACEMNIVELAKRLRLDASTLSRTVDSLVKEGHIDRHENPQNRRSSILGLTPLGQETLKRIDLECNRFYAGLFAQIPAEKQQAMLEAVELLTRLFSGIDDSNLQQGPGCGCTWLKEDQK